MALLCGLLGSAYGQEIDSAETLGSWERPTLEVWVEMLQDNPYKRLRSKDRQIVSNYFSYKVKEGPEGLRKLGARLRLFLRDGEVLAKVQFKCRFKGKKKPRACPFKKAPMLLARAKKIRSRWLSKLKESYQSLQEAQQEEEESKWDWTSKGEVVIELRQFEVDEDDLTEDFGAGIATRISAEAQGEVFTGTLSLFSRIDSQDTGRSTAYFEDTYLAWDLGNHRFLLGSQIINWSATEAFHPADVINSRNFDGSIENAEKLGEPMLQYNWSFEMGSFSMFYFPMVLSPVFPKSNNRLSYLASSQTGGRTFWVNREAEVTDEEFIPQYGARIEGQLDSFDFSLFYIDHIDRSQPLFFLDSAFVIHPYFSPVMVSGLTFQWALGSWIIKGEASYRDFGESFVDAKFGPILIHSDHAQYALGIDYGFAHDGGSESTFIVEGQYYAGVEEELKPQLGIFYNDALIGYRWAANDEMGQEIFISVIKDMEKEELLGNFNYTRRLSDVWKMTVGVRYFETPEPAATPTGLEFYHKDSHVYTEWARYF